MTKDYEDEDYNMKLYENGKPFTLATYNRILNRLDNYKCNEISSKQQDELLERLEILKNKYITEKTT